MTYEIFNLNYCYYRKFQTRWKRKREGWESEKRKIKVLVYDLNVIYKTFDFIIPLRVLILNTLKQMINRKNVVITSHTKISIFSKRITNQIVCFFF